MRLKPLNHPIVTYLCGVRDKARNSVFKIVFDRFENLGNNLLPQGLSLLVDIDVVSTTEINTFERTSGAHSRFDDFLHRCRSISPDD